MDEGVKAKCVQCGNTYKYERHWALTCPYCSCKWNDITFNFDKTYATCQETQK